MINLMIPSVSAQEADGYKTKSVNLKAVACFTSLCKEDLNWLLCF